MFISIIVHAKKKVVPYISFCLTEWHPYIHNFLSYLCVYVYAKVVFAGKSKLG